MIIQHVIAEDDGYEEILQDFSTEVSRTFPAPAATDEFTAAARKAESAKEWLAHGCPNPAEHGTEKVR